MTEPARHLDRAGVPTPNSTPISTPAPSLLWRAARAAVRIWTSVAFDLKVYGKENIPAHGGALFLPNHQSYLDPILVGVQIRRPISYMAKSELFENAIFGRLIRALHAFPVKQGRGDVGAIKQSIARLHEGHILNIFPEGSRSPDGAIAPIQSGVALVVKRADVPIIPVAISGSFRAWPKGRMLPRRTPIRVQFGPALHIDGLSSSQLVELIDRTLRKMFDELNRKVRSR